jgi:hypothetical protein
MTICNPSLPTKPITTCLENLTIGTIADFNQDVKVIVEDITTGRRGTYHATSDGAGLVVVDLSDSDFAESHSYQGWIVKDGDNISDAYSVTIGAETTQFFQLNFIAVIYSAMDETLEAE